MAANFSDLPELYAAPKSPKSPTPAPSATSSQTLAPLRRRPPVPYGNDSYLSTDSQRPLHSPSSSRTSYSALARRQDHINVGIDFGTTYSGVSWIISGVDDARIHTVDNWPNGLEHVKVPTAISYRTNGTIEWGYAISPDAERLSWFKLLLAEEILPPDVRDSIQLKVTKKVLHRLKKSAEEVTADYLRRLWEYALTDIRRQNPRSIDGMPFRIVIGVPANWPQDAQNKMRDAAKQAGLLDPRAGGLMTALEFVAEPEAAALAAFHEGNVRHDIQIDDIVIICDAGGGTVDIVTYEVNGIEPSITLGECIGGDMGLCGSIFLDEGFMKYMEAMIGKDKLTKLPAATLGQLMETWELSIKRQYYHGRSEIATPIPHLVAKAINSPLKKVWRKGHGSKQLTGDSMRFTSEDIKGIFDPVMSDILKLACKQRNETMRKKQKKPKAIFLVGGLGGNRFLNELLQAEFTRGGDIDVIQPRGPNVWASISRGAAIKSMSYDLNQDQPIPVVTSYISKAHYGMEFKEPFNSEKHTADDRLVFDQDREIDFAWDQMYWFVKKGDDISQGTPIETPWAFEQPESRACANYQITIYECEAEIAPNRKTVDVHKCATITFSARSGSSIREGAEGQRYRVVRFDVKMSMLGMGKLDFATYVDGRLASRMDVKVKLGSD